MEIRQARFIDKFLQFGVAAGTLASTWKIKHRSALLRLYRARDCDRIKCLKLGGRYYVCRTSFASYVEGGS